MGDRRDWLPELNGPLIEESPISSPTGVSLSSLSLSSPVASNPRPDSVSADRWFTVERSTESIISHVQPTVISDERRRAVIDYVQQLIRGYVGCEVFPFGSVPLKTYLPDGDIDITAFGGSNHEDALSNEVFSVLEGEEQNHDADFIVKDVQVVNAEVKLVKCLVQNIVVDISFNQLGGLCTLCFLEQVDRLIGKDHLFKRSIILIKTWCYYESRILGAHHGLISTYALETLVLYIFHLFHSRLDGPLSVLYRFLDYFSKFDWENYCISISGPIPISSLPDITAAEKPDNGGLDLLLSTDFLSDCVDMFSVPDPVSRPFTQKHLNIVDPLKDNNNLGRSVSKGNFFRIRSAFAYGARKLGQILDSEDDSLPGFFANTVERHGDGCRPDVDDPPTCSASMPHTYFRPSDLGADIDAHMQSLQYGRYSHFDSVPSWRLHPVPFHRPFFPVFRGLGFSIDDLPKPRGTGTYFPNLHQPDKRRYGGMAGVKGRGLVRSPRGSNGVAEAGMSGRAAVDWTHVQVHPPRLLRPNGALEFGPFVRPRPPPPPPPSSLPPISLGSPGKKSVPAPNDDRGLTYQLKDDEDFPPLTG